MKQDIFFCHLFQERIDRVVAFNSKLNMCITDLSFYKQMRLVKLHFKRYFAHNSPWYFSSNAMNNEETYFYVYQKHCERLTRNH